MPIVQAMYRNYGIVITTCMLLSDTYMLYFVECLPLQGPAFLILLRYGGIAQLVEHMLCRHGVAGSNPTSSTIQNSKNPF